MLSDSAVGIANRHWASEFGIDPEGMFAEELMLVRHAEALADYDGIFALFREGRVMVSLPGDRFEALQRRLPEWSPALDPRAWAGYFRDAGFRVIGPAYIGYAGAVPEMEGVRNLSEADLAAVERLRLACDPEEWDHGGSEAGEVPCSAAFAEDGEIAALAGYEIWSEEIAHISIVAHPGYRGRGYGRAAVAHLAARALRAGLLPQYRTLEANAPSVAIARALGFERYGCSVAVRLAGGG
ncbi:GNAT family N-acetyltransferase [Haloferula sp. BvORR071]|uniref:GNAT family N-acetyltransferase n=1 Tax=Haloferula sp. BvORR071 TaxID=1396141 RepID=UPI0005590B2F|nr:GNAT family N-acetyltransferase [Haloferula sp. BvORR071]